MKKKMYGEIQANLPIAQSPSLATLRLFLLQAGGWRLWGVLSGASVNRLQSNPLGSTLCKASPLPVFLPIVL